VSLGAPSSSAAPIYKVVLNDVIHGVTAGHVIDTIRAAAEDDAELVLIELETPGGLLVSTRAMIEAILNSERPIVVYVAPAGARAASAGFLIALSADVAAMAPGTNMGAATPVSGTGQEIEGTMQKKVISDAAAYTRTIAERRNRNPEVAEKAVTETLSWTATEAKDAGLIDFIVTSEPELLEILDGMTISRAGGDITLATAGQDVVLKEMTRKQQILSFIANPNIAVRLGMIGLAGLYLEFSNPGVLVPGILGGIAILLAAFAFEILPVNIVGVVLLVAGFGLLIVEAFTPSFGVVGMGGVVGIVLGALFLFEEQPLPTPALRVSLGVILPVAVLLGLIVVVVGRKVVEAQRRPSVTGSEALVGTFATTKTAIEGHGKVFVHGEYWDARAGAPIGVRERVKIIAVDGLMLSVEHAPES
jgi:membrane-bound serine protease (ClpP class)